MDAFDLTTVEAVKSGEAAEAAQTGELNDATYEPSGRLEQTGDYRISEAIQADFTAVIDNTAAAAAGQSIGEKPDEGDGTHSGKDGGDAIWGYEPKDIQGGPGDNDNATADSGRRGSLTLQGSEDGNTVAGREPKAVEGLLGESGDGGSGDGGENITPINLPNVRDESRPAKGEISRKAGGELGVEIDPDTGQVSGTSGGGGENKPGYVAAAAKPNSGSALGPDRNPGELGNTPPPRMAEPAEGREPSRRPVGPDASDEPPAVGKPGKGLTQGSAAPTGPEILNDDRFADQALGALGYGLIGTKSGTKGEASGIGAVGHGGKALGKSYGSTGGAANGSSSSGGGAPVHGYGPGATGDGSKESDFNCKGKTKDGKSVSIVGTSNSDAKSTAERAGDAGRMVGGRGTCTVKDGQSYYKVVWNTRSDGLTLAGIQKVINSIDGGSAIPYTGSWSDGKFQPGNPGTKGGKDQEDDSGRVMPVIRNGGMGDQGGGSGNAGDPNPWDDGNWYGGIFGGGGVYTDSGGSLPIDPKPH